MILAASVVLAASALLTVQDTRAPHAHPDASSVYGSAEEEVRSLALNLDHAIKVCSEESVRAAARRKDVGRAEKRAVDSGLLSWFADPPAALVAHAKGRPARYGRWADPHATVFMIAYDVDPTCRILVGGSPWTGRVRPALYAKIQDDHFWQSDGPEQPFDGDSVRATFHADLPASVNSRPVISISAPASPREGATQLSIGVHMLNKEEK